jgi:hypothetical protein
MKRLLALVAGGLGLGAFLRRRRRPALPASPAEDLRAKLESSKGLEAERAEFESGETPVDQVSDVDTRRADVQARARRAIDELGESSSPSS